jgi:hypothetical protein
MAYLSMKSGIRWTVNDKESNSIYLCQERWGNYLYQIIM